MLEGSTLDGGWLAIALAQLIAVTVNVWRGKDARSVSAGEVMRGWGALPHLAQALCRAEKEEEKRQSDAVLIGFAQRFGALE